MPHPMLFSRPSAAASRGGAARAAAMPAGRPPRGAFTAVAVAAATAAVLASAAPASAGTLSYDGDDLVYEAAPGERNDVTVHESRRYGAGAVTFGDSGASFTYPTDQCVQVEPGWVDCNAAAGVFLVLGDGDDTTGYGVSEKLLNPLVVDGGAGSDTLRGNAHNPSAAALIGGPGADTLRGGIGEEELHGGEGDDTVQGGAGRDQLYGEGGDDTLDGDGYADPAPDLIDGGAGTDRANGWTDPSRSDHSPVAITLDSEPNDGRAGEGDDVRAVERFTSHVSGRWQLTDADDVVDIWANLGGGASTVVAAGGADRVTGGSYSETIDGGAGDDRLEGGFGDDQLTGGPGRDQLYGDRTGEQCGLFETCTVPFGNDLIDARDGGPDSVDCGPGSDRAIVDPADTVSGCETVDRGAGPAPGAPAGSNGPGGTAGPNPTGAPGTASPWSKLAARRRGRTVTVTARLALPAGAARCDRQRVRLTVRGADGHPAARKTVRLAKSCRLSATLAVRRGSAARTLDLVVVSPRGTTAIGGPTTAKIG